MDISVLEQVSYLLTGATAGILAGLLGVGGGIVVVPILTKLFASHFPPNLIMHMAVGTSLAIMIFTALSSAYAYYRRRLIVWPLFYKFIPGLILGTATGAIVARRLSSRSLAIAFAIFIIGVAIQLFFSKQPKSSRQLPEKLGLGLIAFCIGLCSGFFGVGGGSMMVPFFVYCNVEMHKATGTSSLCGFQVALAGTISLLLSSWASLSAAPLPTGTIGYIYWPAALLVAATSLFFAPLGTRLAVWLPAPLLKRIFALILVLTAINLLRG